MAGPAGRPACTSDEQAHTFQVQMRLLELVSELALANPFLPERKTLERKILGREWEDTGPVWSLTGDPAASDPNVARIVERLAPVLEEMRPGPRELSLYQDGVLFLLYHRYAEPLDRIEDATKKSTIYPRFARDLSRLLHRPGLPPIPWKPAHLFAVFFQLRRAFSRLFESVVGTSKAAARLRASAWQSVFTRDIRRYLSGLHHAMQDFTTLITGPSGSGKELVARAIGLSQYAPFDERSLSFAVDPEKSFFPLNLSALSPALVESELFGHVKGAFTGAVRDRAGWLEVSGAHGTVFLDEIGEIDEGLQVKLLRVLQTRGFQRLGETIDRSFEGKLVAATNRDLALAIREGRFREDFYYRLCADMVVTPSLFESLEDAPDDLGRMIRFIAERIVGAQQAEAIAEETERWIARHLGRGYRWPGNFRELEQCVRNVMVRGEYRPRAAPPEEGAEARLLQIFRRGNLTAEQVLRLQCSAVFAETESYVETARRLGLDRRTVKNRVDRDLVAKVKGG
jgi:DNA-binding NtrC family response regulator